MFSIPQPYRVFSEAAPDYRKVIPADALAVFGFAL
ncbi:hypothetical protein AZE42_11413 [Rhizopogon vesiculosus]|uniref:Uncharacterized protein n=1 Tax=Rhizopogon vesiculosus TaxID=180088 RepID=A0A1J8QN01_9AGAM|nr:hypothetical protein AZE42_11413 [Rhizopogon vesiculosus]